MFGKGEKKKSEKDPLFFCASWRVLLALWLVWEVLLGTSSGYGSSTCSQDSTGLWCCVLPWDPICKWSTGGGWKEKGKREREPISPIWNNLIFLLLIWQIHIILPLKRNCWICHSVFYRLPVAISPTLVHVIYHTAFKSLHSFEWVSELLVPPPTHWFLPFSPSTPGNQQFSRMLQEPT